MRFLFCIIGFVFLYCGNTQAEETEGNNAPIIEPITQDINARLDRVEKMLNNKALIDMLGMLESLKVDVNTLRGEIEVQTHTIEQLKQKQRNLYTDVDRRIQRIESNKTNTSASPDLETLETMGEEQGGNNTAEGEGLVVETDSEIANKTEAAEEKEPADPLKAEATYQRAFKLLKESQYDQALKAFKDFLKDYPDSAFSDNAQYWLGEANYVTQKYDLAINEYRALLNTYPDSQKVSHALLKIGYSYAELGNSADAKKMLKDVMKQYPGTTAARLADERLRKINTADDDPST